MRVLFTLEQHFIRTPDGAIWAQATGAYPFWTRYLQVFESVQVLARVGESVDVPSSYVRADGAGVSFARLPNYIGPLRYLMNLPKIAAAMRAEFQYGDAVVLRVPSALATNLGARLYRKRYPYALKVVGDPRDAFASGAVRHPLRAVWRRWFSSELRRLCASATAAMYVTQTVLQQRYPCPGYTIAGSDVELDDAAFVPEPRMISETPRPFRLVFIGSLEQMYKGPDVLIDSLAKCKRNGLDLSLEMIGEGRHRAELERLARRLGVSDCVTFSGQLPAGEAVRKRLDAAALFVLPSKAEGLPRAMVEAMARALPCIGSTIGGIPELLSPEDMVPPGDADALARKICEVAADAPRQARMSRRNLQKAKPFEYKTLLEQELAFCRYLKNCTEVWLRREGVR